MVDVIRSNIIEQLPPVFLGVSSANVEVRFYKLAVYEAGGHFQKHRDTVHSSDHKATLLIEVRSEHIGGDFIIEKNGIKRFWKLSKKYEKGNAIPQGLLFSLPSDDDDSAEGKTGERKSCGISAAGAGADDAESGEEDAGADDEDKEDVNVIFDEMYEDKGIQWCIFYTDVEHQVELVMKGIRMVLQFDVYCKEGGQSNKRKADKIEGCNATGGYTLEADNESEGDDGDNNKEDRNNDIFELSKVKCLDKINTDVTAVSKKSVLQKIVKCLLENLSNTKAIAIPLYYLYTLQSIDCKSLKNMDRELFDFLVEDGFSVGLSPIELISKTDYQNGDFSGSGSGYQVRLHDFPIRIYQKSNVGKKGRSKGRNAGNHENHKITFQYMPEWPESVSLTYVYSGMESSLLYESKEFIEYTGNESAQGIHRYLCGTMIIFKKKQNARK
jgi:hypothetical protein